MFMIQQNHWFIYLFFLISCNLFFAQNLEMKSVLLGFYLILVPSAYHGS